MNKKDFHGVVEIRNKKGRLLDAFALIHEGYRKPATRERENSKREIVKVTYFKTIKAHEFYYNKLKAELDICPF